MAPWPAAHLLAIFVGGGHSSEPYWVAIPLIGLALLLRALSMRRRSGGRFGGPWGRGPSEWGNGPSQEPPQQWDIRKPTPPPPTEGEAGPQTQEHNPPSDL